MKYYNYASIDIETLGLKPQVHKVIEIGIVLDNSLTRTTPTTVEKHIETLPTFHCYIRYDKYEGDSYAVNMNKKVIELIQANKDITILNLCEVAPAIDRFFSIHLIDKITPAGKNFSGFDRPFLNEIPKLEKVLDKWLIHRVHDPAAYYFDPNMDNSPPSLQECLNRARISKRVTHRAIDDALDVIRLLRRAWDDFNWPQQ